MRTRHALTIGALFGLLSATALAQSSKTGTSGAAFLKLDGAARPAALGNAFVGIAEGANALPYNPAGIAFTPNIQMSATRTQWFQDIDANQGTFVFPSEIGSFGLSALTMNIDGLEKRDSDETSQGQFDALDAAYNLTYAKNVSNTWSFGVSARYIKQEIDGVSATSWGGDVGTFKRFQDMPLTCGLAVRNMGQEVKFNEEGDPLPVIFDAGLGSSLLKNKLVFGLHAQKPRDNNIQYGLGSEWNQPLGASMRASLRIGYQSNATDPSGAHGISFGAGMRLNRLEFDISNLSYGSLGDVFKFTLLLHI